MTTNTTGTATKPSATVTGSDGVAVQVPAAVGERVRELEKYADTFPKTADGVRIVFNMFVYHLSIMDQINVLRVWVISPAGEDKSDGFWLKDIDGVRYHAGDCYSSEAAALSPQGGKT